MFLGLVAVAAIKFDDSFEIEKVRGILVVDGVQEVVGLVGLASFSEAFHPAHLQGLVVWDFVGEVRDAGESLRVVILLLCVQEAVVVGFEGFRLFELVIGGNGLLDGCGLFCCLNCLFEPEQVDAGL